MYVKQTQQQQNEVIYYIIVKYIKNWTWKLYKQNHKKNDTKNKKNQCENLHLNRFIFKSAFESTCTPAEKLSLESGHVPWLLAWHR